MLITFWPQDPTDEDEEGEEYEPTDMVDELTGPDNVEVNEMGTVLRNNAHATCAICAHADINMRKLNVCPHTYCADRLDAQLHTQHASRYKCALCRAYLLQ
jgi:hypothetical protein